MCNPSAFNRMLNGDWSLRLLLNGYTHFYHPYSCLTLVMLDGTLVCKRGREGEGGGGAGLSENQVFADETLK